MIQAFLESLEGGACELLVAQNPSLRVAVDRLARAWDQGISVLDLLVAQRAVDRREAARALAAAPPAGLTWGDYAIERELGRGANGVVLLARRRGRRCALKILRKGGRNPARRAARFRREAAVLARLDHPGIVRLLDHGELDGQLYLATECLPGGSLAGYAPQTPARALEILSALIDALEFAHAAGVVHRDLKPTNVLLDAGGAPKLVDFGLAKDEEGEQLTGTRTILGSLSYAAPEQLGWARGAGPKADVYGLGALLFYLLSGWPPFEKATLPEHLVAIKRGPRPLPSSLATYEPLLRRILDRDPAIRPSLKELRRELRRLR